MTRRRDSQTRLHPFALALAAVLSVGALLGMPPQAIAAVPTTFSNTTSIAIPATGSPNQSGAASPYPSTIPVSGMPGSVSKVTVTLPLPHAQHGH